MRAHWVTINITDFTMRAPFFSMRALGKYKHTGMRALDDNLQIGSNLGSGRSRRGESGTRRRKRQRSETADGNGRDFWSQTAARRQRDGRISFCFIGVRVQAASASEELPGANVRLNYFDTLISKSVRSCHDQTSVLVLLVVCDMRRNAARRGTVQHEILKVYSHVKI